MPNIRDVAKMAGVSPASVSRILNHDHQFHINENTRQRVIEIAKRIGYSKDKNKSGPKGQKGMSIGLILRHTQKNEANDPYFKNIHEGIVEEAKKWRLNTEVVFRMHDKNKDLDQLPKYGAIILVGQMTDEAIKSLQKKNANLIMVDANPNLDSVFYIKNDFEEQTKKILDYLYKLGHRNIAYIGGHSSIVDLAGKTILLDSDKRAVTYSNWMKLKGLDQYRQIYINNWSIENGFKLCNDLLADHGVPDAILVGSDPMALGVYKSLNNHHVAIPKDVSVVSFDDVEMNRYLTPSLSSVYMDSVQMGRVAVKLAKEIMIDQSKEKMPLVITCKSTLHVRESIEEKL